MLQPKQTIFSIAYFPPVHYFYELCNAEQVLIEQFENYTKQSYRNRCEILSPNGKQILSIPVIKKSGEKQIIKDIRIDYKNNWQAIHLKSLKTAYLSSPFYEFYIDALKIFFEKKYTFLFDFNLEIIQTLLSELGINKELLLSNNFQKQVSGKDLRHTIHPKKAIKEYFPHYKAKTYTQVFFDRYSFVPNLSVLDLLFNEGPNTEYFLLPK